MLEFLSSSNLFSLKEYIFVWDFFPSDCLLYTPFIDLVLSTMWLHFSFSKSTNFCKVTARAAHVTLWVVYVNNNNKTPEASSLFPVVSHWPLFSLKRFYLWLIFFFLPTGNFQTTVLLHLISWLFLDLRINYWNVSDALRKCQCIWLDLLRSTAFQPTWYWNWISSSAFSHISFSQPTQKHNADDL